MLFSHVLYSGKLLKNLNKEKRIMENNSWNKTSILAFVVVIAISLFLGFVVAKILVYLYVNLFIERIIQELSCGKNINIFIGVIFISLLVIAVVVLSIFSSFKLIKKWEKKKIKEQQEDLGFANSQIEVIQKELASAAELCNKEKMPQSFLDEIGSNRRLLVWYLNEKKRLEGKLGIK